MLKAAVAVVVVATFSNAAWAQSEGDRIKALEEMIQKQQAQIEAQ
jgi:cytoskeletal protein RodZ